MAGIGGLAKGKSGGKRPGLPGRPGRANKPNRSPFNRNANNQQNSLKNQLSNRRLANRNNGYTPDDEDEDEEYDEDGNPIEKSQDGSGKQSGNAVSNRQSGGSEHHTDTDESSESESSGGMKIKIHVPIKVKLIIIGILALILLFVVIILIVCSAVAGAFGGTLEISGATEMNNTGSTSDPEEPVNQNPCETLTLINCRKGFDETAGETLPEGAELCKVHNQVPNDRRYYYPNDPNYVHKDVPFEKYVAGVVAAEVGGLGITTGQVFAVAARTDGIIMAKDSVKSSDLDDCTIEYSNRTQVYKSPTAESYTAAESTKDVVLKDSNNNLLEVGAFYDAFACSKINGNKIVTLHGEDFYIINQPVLNHQLVPREWVISHVPQEYLECDGSSHHGMGASQLGAYYLATVKHYSYEDIIDYYYDDYIDNNPSNGDINCHALAGYGGSCSNKVLPDFENLYNEVKYSQVNEDYVSSFGWPSQYNDVPKPSFSDHIWYESENIDEVDIYIYNCDKSQAESYISSVKSGGWNQNIDEDDEDDYSEEGNINDEYDDEILLEFSGENSDGDQISISYTNLTNSISINITRHPS